MTTFILVGVASSLAAIAIIILKNCGGKREKLQKSEKAQIINQLLALSEREDLVNGNSRQQSVSQFPSRGRTLAAKSTSPSRAVHRA